MDGRDDDRERERRLVLFRLVLDLVEIAFLLVFFLLFVLLRLLFFLLVVLFLCVLLCVLFVLVGVDSEREWERERDDAVGVSGVVSSTVDVDRLDEVEWSDEGVAGESVLLDLSGTFGTSGTSTASDASDASEALDTEDTFAYEEERLEDGEDGIGSVRVEE